MDLQKLSALCLKIASTIIAAFLIIGGVGACVNHMYIQGGAGIIAAPVIVFLGYRPASIISWVLVLAIFFVTMLIVGNINH